MTTVQKPKKFRIRKPDRAACASSSRGYRIALYPFLAGYPTCEATQDDADEHEADGEDADNGECCRVMKDYSAGI